MVMMMIKNYYILRICLLLTMSFSQPACALTLCTACNAGYFKRLLNFIGSLHQVNFDELDTLAVYNIGLTDEQINHLQAIEKLEVREVRKVHRDILKPFHVYNGKYVPGWYAWKPVLIKQELEIHPTVLYCDAGTTVLQSLVPLFKHIEQNGYFLTTIGLEDSPHGPYRHDINSQTTAHVRRLFNLDRPENQELLKKEAVSGSPIGVSRNAQHLFIDDLYALAHDLKNYADDGKAPGGWGSARHDQALLGVIAYQKNLQVLRQDLKQITPLSLIIDGYVVPFYVGCKRLTSKTCLYQSRSNMGNYAKYEAAIRYKEGMREKYQPQHKL